MLEVKKGSIVNTKCGAAEPTHLSYSQRKGNRHSKIMTGRENPII